MNRKKIAANIGALALSFISVSCGCGRATPEHAPQLDVGSFGEYVTRFEQEAKANGLNLIVTDLRIRFGKMDNPYERGICDIIPGESPTITLKESAWDLMSDEEREELVFHELGHCVLRRKHLSAKSTEGQPSSLMYPYAIDRVTYRENQQHYMHELFSATGDF